MSYNRNLSARSNRRSFANPAVTSTSYAGELALPFLTPAVKSADTLAKNFVRQIDNVRYKAVIQTASVEDDIIQASGCGFDDGNSVTLDESILTLKDLKVNEKLCRGTLIDTWVGASGSRLTEQWATPEFRQFVLGTVAGKVGASVETNLWQGSTIFGAGFLSNTGLIAGFSGGSLASATTVAKSGAFTATNVVTNFATAYNKAATDKPAILSKPDVAFYVSNKTYAFYIQHLAGVGGTLNTGGGQGVNNMGPSQNFLGMTYLGVPINVCPGMFDDVMVLGQQENLVVGTNVQTDYTNVRYIPAFEYDGSDNVLVVMQFGMGTAAGIAADVIVLK